MEELMLVWLMAGTREVARLWEGCCEGERKRRRDGRGGVGVAVM